MKNEQTQAPPKWKAYTMKELAAAFFADLHAQEPRRPQEDQQKDGGRPAA